MDDKEFRRIAMRRYRARRRAAGGPLSVPIEQAQERLKELRKAGMGYDCIARASGIDRRLLQHMAAGHLKGKPYRRITLDTWKRLEAVEPEPHIVPAKVTHRMLHALQAQGWSLRAIDRERNVPVNNTHNLVMQDRVLRSTQTEIHLWFEKLSGGPPKPTTASEKRSQNIAKRRARQRGWAPPHAWNDVLDPNERPKGVVWP